MTPASAGAGKHRDDTDRLAALARGHDLDLVAGRELGLGPRGPRHEVAVQRGRHLGLIVAQRGNQLGQRRGAGLGRLAVDDNP